MHNRSAEKANATRDDRTLRVANHVVSTKQGDATILLDVRRGKYYTLNPAGGRIWDLLVEGVSVSSIVERLMSEFEVSTEILSADVKNFVAQLHGSKLIGQ